MKPTEHLCISLAVAAVSLVGAQAYASPSVKSLVNQSLEMMRSDGGRARLVFLPHGKVLFQGAKTDDVMSGHGTYTVSGQTFCYATDFPGKECWRLSSPLRVGKAVRAVSPEGAISATLTLRSGETAVMPKAGL